MNKIDVSIVIVSFNTRDLTVECIRSVVRTIKKSFYEIIVVDNNSEDDSVEKISKIQDPRQGRGSPPAARSKIQIIPNKENLGFAKANNIGVKEASGRYILFLNSDTVVYDNTIDGIVKFMDEHPEAGASTCFVRLPNGKLDDAAHRGFPTPWRAISKFSGLSKIFPKVPFFAGYSLTYLPTNTTHEIEALAGAFMLVRREAGDQAGWWDEDYFFYGEDIDFCYTLREHSWKIYFVPEFEILHYKGVSGGLKKDSQNITTATRETRKMATNARFAAMKIFYDKHYKGKYPSFLRNLVLAGISVKKFLAEKKI